MINVAIVESNKSIRNGLKALIEGTSKLSCLHTFPKCDSLLKEIHSLKVDVIIMDINNRGNGSTEGIKKIKKECPDINIVVLTIYESRTAIINAICAGACGYILKSSPPNRIIEAVIEVYNGGAPMSSKIARQVINIFKQQAQFRKENQFSLTSKEKIVLNHLSIGNNYKEISNELKISIDTVRHYIRNIYRKLEVHSQSAAVAKALKQGLIN